MQFVNKSYRREPIYMARLTSDFKMDFKIEISDSEPCLKFVLKNKILQKMFFVFVFSLDAYI